MTDLGFHIPAALAARIRDPQDRQTIVAIVAAALASGAATIIVVLLTAAI